jgi:hypothetical protein
VSVQRRDAEGRRQVGPSWESLVERQIREAMAEGAFDDLPFRGEPLPLEDDGAAGDWAMAHRMLKNAGAAPPWIEADKEARRLLAAIERLIQDAPRMSMDGRRRARNDCVRLVQAANEAITRVNSEAPTDRQHRRPLDPEAVAARLEAEADPI